MRIISKRTLRQFWLHHPQAEEPLKAWYPVAEKAKWETPSKVKEQFGNASIVGNNRVVFNVHGNSYRLVVKVEYQLGIVFVRFVGTRAEYDTIDVETV
jgi:mRNA interferase HigB